MSDRFPAYASITPLAEARLRRSLAALVTGALLLGASFSGCGLVGGELPPQQTRLTSPDGRTDLVLTWRGGGGAAGWSEQHIALVSHGRHAGEADDRATLDPDDLVGARWLSSDVAEIGLDGAAHSGSLPTLVRIGGKVIAVRVRDFGHCLPAAVRDLPPRAGMTVRVTGWDCGGGVGRLALSWRDRHGGDPWWGLADAAVRWPARLDVTVRRGRVSIPARRIYGGEPHEQVGGPDGRTITVSWAGE